MNIINSEELVEYLNHHDNFNFNHEKSGFSNKDQFWKASTLYNAVKEQECVEYNFDLLSFDFELKVWKSPEFLDSFIVHMDRVLKTDTNIPIIVSPRGQILDGYHRIVKRILIDKGTSIKAYRLKELPKEDMVLVKGKWEDNK